jgi:uncharacterized membrane protein
MSDVITAKGDPADQRVGKERWAPALSPARNETLCDGVLAIAMTILVLELPVPHLFAFLEAGDAPTSFLEMWAEFYTYVLGFLVLGVYWVLHSYMFHFIKRSDGVLMWLNILFLVLAALVPFSTKALMVNEALIPTAGSEPNAAGTFFNVAAIGSILLLLAMWQYATRGHRLVAGDIDARTVSGINRVILIGVAIMSAGILLSYVFPLGALLGFVAMAFVVIATARGRYRPAGRTVENAKEN